MKELSFQEAIEQISKQTGRVGTPKSKHYAGKTWYAILSLNIDEQILPVYVTTSDSNNVPFYYGTNVFVELPRDCVKNRMAAPAIIEAIEQKYRVLPCQEFSNVTHTKYLFCSLPDSSDNFFYTSMHSSNERRPLRDVTNEKIDALFRAVKEYIRVMNDKKTHEIESELEKMVK